MNKNISREQVFSSGIEFKGKNINHLKFKLKSRAQATMTLYDNKLYIFGGLNNSSLGDLWINDFTSKLNYKIDNFSWTIINTRVEPLPRYGHTAVLYKKEIYIYGGSTDITFIGREDIVIYDIEKKRFKIEEKTFNKANFKWRRNHTADMVGNHMVIYGGIDDMGNILDDLWALDLNLTLRWNFIDTKGKQKALAHHCSTLIVSSEKKNHPQFNLFKFPDLPSGRTTIRGSKVEGIAFFGGIDDERCVNNEFKILKIGKKPLEWVTPIVKGTLPEGRQNATLNFYEALNVLILFGGQNQRQEYLNDLFVLDLDTFNWMKVLLYQDIPMIRSEHCSAIINNQLVIFGGINGEIYVGSDIFIVNLDIFEKKSNAFNKFVKKLNLYK